MVLQRDTTEHKSAENGRGCRRSVASFIRF